MWYVAIICNEMQWPLEEVMAANTRKLQARYPDKFTTKAATQRDLFAEQQAMNGGEKL